MKIRNIILAVCLITAVAVAVLSVFFPNKRRVVFEYERIPCVPAAEITTRRLSSPQPVELPANLKIPEQFKHAKITYRVYEPTWIDSRHLPQRLDELSFSEPEDVELAYHGRNALRRNVDWVKQCVTKESYDMVFADVEKRHAKTPRASLDEVDGDYNPLRYWYRIDIETKDNHYALLYFDIMQKGNADGTFFKKKSLIAFCFRKVKGKWKRDFSFGSSFFGDYLRYDMQYDLLKLAPFENAKDVDKKENAK